MGALDELLSTPKPAGALDDLLTEGDVARQKRPGILREIGGQLVDAVTHHLPGAFGAALEGTDPYEQRDWRDTLVERSRKKSEERAMQPGGDDPLGPFGLLSRDEVRGLGPSLGFSGVGIGAGLAAGIPAAITGSAVSTPAGGAFAGYTAGGAASGKAAYNMAANQFLRDTRRKEDEAAQKARGRPLSDVEWKELEPQYLDLAKEYGLWEAIPEAAGNMMGAGILMSKAKNLVPAGLAKAVDKNILTRGATKLAAMQASELPTETVTGMGQHNVSIDAGLQPDGTAKRSFTNASDWLDTFKEIVGPTMLQTAITAGIGGAGVAGYRALKGKKEEPPPEPVPATTPHDQALREVARKAEGMETAPDPVATPPVAEKGAPSEPAPEAATDTLPQAYPRELDALRGVKDGNLTPEDSQYLVDAGLARQKKDGGLTLLPAGRRRWRELEDVKAQPEADPADVKVRGTPVADMDDAALADAAQNHPMSAQREAAKVEAERRAQIDPPAGPIADPANLEDSSQNAPATGEKAPEAGQNGQIPPVDAGAIVNPVPAIGNESPAQQEAGAVLGAATGPALAGPSAKPVDSGRSGVELQNRNRSSAASIAQMQAIAANPDPARLSFSRDMVSGAPVVVGEPKGAVFGKSDTIVSGTGRKIAVRYAVVEADELVASNSADGTRVPEYADASRVRAVAGNGRLAGLKEAYSRGTAAGYSEGIGADTGLHGVPAEAVKALRQPVLVRLMDAKDVTENIGDESNIAQGAALDAVEQARTDVRRVNIDGLEFTDEGGVSPDSLKRFVQAMPATEQAGLIESNGQPSQKAEDRLVAAVFWQAYADAGLTELAVQSRDPEAKTIVQALTRAAPAMMRLEGALDLDFRGAVRDAAKLAITARRQGVKLDVWLKQGDFELTADARVVAEMFAKNIRSTKAIAERLIHAADFAHNEATKAGFDMFGAVQKATRAQVLGALDDTARQEALEQSLGRQPDAGNAGREASDAAGPGDRGAVGQDQQGEAKPAEVDDKTAAQAEFDSALDELGEWIEQRAPIAKMISDAERKALLPILSKLFSAATKLGYVKFKDALAHVLKGINGNEKLRAVTAWLGEEDYREAFEAAGKPADAAPDNKRATPESDATLARFRPRGMVIFKKPYTGKTGAKLTGYEWKWRAEGIVDRRGEDRTIRVSDWEEAITNPATNRDIVHQFQVTTPDGRAETVSAETAAKMLGVSDSTARGAARRLLEDEMRQSQNAERLEAKKQEMERGEWHPTPAAAVNALPGALNRIWNRYRKWGGEPADRSASMLQTRIWFTKGPKGYQALTEIDDDARGWKAVTLTPPAIWDKNGHAKPADTAGLPTVKQRLFVQRGTERFEVESLKEAAAKWQDFFRAAVNAGAGGENGSIGGATVVDQDGKEVAEIGQNGRVWPPGGWKPGVKPLMEADGGTPAPAESGAKPDAAPEKRYEYGLTLRPVSFATVPKGFIEFGKNEKYPHGTVSYAKPLLRKDIEHFDLEPLDPRDPINVRKRRDALAEKIEKIFLRDGGVKAVYPDGRSLLLSENASGDVPLRVTSFLADGTPSGHREYDSINNDRPMDSAVGEFLDPALKIVDDDRPALDLEQQSPADLKAKADAETAAAKQKADEEAAAEAKRKADAEARAPLALTGSDRPADANPGQADIFSQPNPMVAAADALIQAAEAMKAAVSPRVERPASKADSTPNTEDAGAELTFNRRNRIKTGIKWDDIADKNEALRVSETTKQNVYPKPDYDALIAGGMDPMIAHLVKQAYDAIAAKPATRSAPTDADLKLYIEGVNRAMSGALAWAKDERAVARWAQSQGRVAAAMLGKPTAMGTLAESPRSMLDAAYPQGWRGSRDEVVIVGGNRILRALQPGYDEAARAMKAVKHGWPSAQEAWQKQGYAVTPKSKVTFTFADGVRRDGVFYSALSYRAEGQRSGYKAFDGETAEEARALAVAHRDSIGEWVATQKNGDMIGSYATEEEAREAVRAATKRDGKTQISDKGISVEAAERVGEDRRKEGEDISSDQLKDAFGFKGVNFGTWMKGDSNKAERQLHLNHAYDAFMDLAELLGVPPRALSLNGMLGVAIGAQGGGNYAAHFVPGVNEINLTRTSGAGSLAHEWGHAMDHYFATQAGLARATDPFLTEHVTNAKTLREGLRPEIAAAFKAVVDAMNLRPMTPDEVTTERSVRIAKAKKNLNSWVGSVWRETGAVVPEQRAAAQKRFDAIADRLSAGDTGDGFVRSGNKQFSPAVAELREFMKSLTGRLLPTETSEAIEANARHLKHLLSQKEAAANHVPQQVRTDYAANAAGLDKGKQKRYWSTELEKFARAFDAFVSDALAERAAKNTYLSHAGRTGETVPAGGERTAINKAFQALVGAIETKETDRGVAMFSRAAPATYTTTKDGRPLLRNGGMEITDPAYWQTMYGQRIYQSKIVADGKHVGHVTLGWKDGKAVSLMHIEVAEEHRGRGYAERAVKSILQHNGDAELHVMHIQPKARGFWVKLGTDPFKTETGEDGILTEASYLSARGNRADSRADVEDAAGQDPDQGNAGEQKAAGFSREDGGQALGLGAEKVRRIIAPVLKAWGRDIPVVVVDSMQDPRIPQDARDENDAQLSQGATGEPEGFLLRGKVYLIASALNSPAAVYRVLFHEALGHYGLRGVFGSRLNAVLESVAQTMPERIKQYPHLSRLAAAEEVLAELAQTRPQAGLVKRAIAAIRQFLRDIGIDLKLSDNDIIVNFILPARAFVEGRGEGAAVGSAAPAFGRPSAPWYSDLSRAIEKVGMNAAPAKGWKDYLKGLTAKGVKADEIEWSGINDWLDLQGAKVTKAQVLDYLAANGVRVEETMLGNEGEAEATAEIDRLKVELDALGFDIENDPHAEIFGVIRRSDKTLYSDSENATVYDDGLAFSIDELPKETADAVYRLRDLLEAADDEYGARDNNNTKFSQYTLPGGKNYRELLLTLPPKNVDQVFGSSHFDTPNILVHVRFNERTDADGKRVLFVEEFQSDWAQKGKREGFKSGKEEPQFRYRVVADNHNLYVDYDTREEAERAIEEGQRANFPPKNPRIEKMPMPPAYVKGVPSAPFVGKTEAWVSLALKRMIRYAAENGFDRVAWTTGEQQAARYDLSKQVERVSYRVDSNGYDLVARRVGDTKMTPLADNVPEDRLADYVGKELAEKMKRGEGQKGGQDWKAFEGVSLRIGGEGMRAFYDKIVPNVANDVLKKLGGGRVGSASIDMEPKVPEKYRVGRTGDLTAFQVFDEDDQTVKKFDTEEAAQDYADELNAAEQTPGGRKTQRAFDITPQMAEKALGGMPMFSRAPGAFSDAATYTNLAGAAREGVGNLLTSQRTFNRWWHRTVGTQFHKAQTDRDFRKVFDLGQDYLTDTSRFAMMAEAEAPSLLLRMEGVSDILKRGISKADLETIAAPIFEGTLEEKTFTDAQLRTLYGLNDQQVTYYQEFRAATDKSLEELAKSTMAKMAKAVGVNMPGVVAMRGKTFEEFHTEVLSLVRRRAEFMAQRAADADPSVKPLMESQAAEARKQGVALSKLYNQVEKLKAKGYAPLMRFGEYTVYVTEQANPMEEPEQVYFGMYETQAEANRAAKALREEFPDANVNQGVLSQEAYRAFQGLSPDTLEIFAKAAGLDKEPVFQEYLRLAVNNRSAMKRLMKRKGVPGFSQDATRVLAAFVTSNARLTASNYHLGEMQAAVDAIPKEKGDVKDEATKLWKYLVDPQEEAGALRGFLFFQYLGGSIASALVNATQPVTMTAPYLAKYASPAKVAAELAKATMEAAKNRVGDDVRAVYARAVEEGLVAPHEIYQLMAQARGSAAGATGMHRAMKVWGAFFSLAEAFNRRATFLAAYRIGRANGVADAYAFARQAVHETQGLYNKGNRPNWARGAVGATLFTFKQFSISYVEFLKRLHDTNKPAFWMAIAILALAAGLEGLPFAEDIEDLLDTIGQWMGHNTNSKKWLRQRAAEILGEGGAEFVLHGFSAIPGVPLDVSNRLGMQNLIPGSALLKPSETDKARDVAEFLGPVGGLAQNIGKGVTAAAKGDAAGAVRAVLPLALQNLAKGAEMWEKGYYTDTKGRKVLDTTGGEAVLKAAGFQPAIVAAESRRIGIVKQDIDLHKKIEAAIADRWARGVVDKRPELMAEARKELAAWNAKNPDARIILKPEQIRRRVAEAMKTRADRFSKTAPPEIRRDVAREIRQ